MIILTILFMDLIDNLGLLKCVARPHYIFFDLEENQKAELRKVGETIVELPLRKNHPVLTGIMYKDGVQRKCATIVVKKRLGKSYFYVLQNELKKEVK